MPRPPGDGTLGEQFTRLARRVEELSRRRCVRIASGWEPITGSLTYSNFYGTGMDIYRGQAEVTFPDGLFTTTPIITVTANTSVPGSTFMEASFMSASATGMTLVAARLNDTTTYINWIAVQT